jgi:putative DNA primase/helicase
MNATLEAALDYAALGFSVFPCCFQLKEPATRRGFYNATTNPATIRRCFGSTQAYNIGIRTGLASGVWVLDVDGPEGAASLRALEERNGPLPTTRRSQSARGFHLWWRTDLPAQCSAGRVAPHIDVRGDNGYVLGPPSIHPSGHTYQWISTEPLAVAPEWLLRLTCKRPSPAAPPPGPPSGPTGGNNGPHGAYGKAALDREIETLASTAPGARNHAHRASFSLHQLVAGGELDGAEVQQRLLGAAIANGLMSDPADGPRSVMATIRSGARAGMQHPRFRPIGGHT